MVVSEPITLHASCVSIGGRAILLSGVSGAGKSDLALRLIDRGAVLISDDYTALYGHDGGLVASPPLTIAGKIEVRGIGIVERPFLSDVPVCLFVELGRTVDRMPEHGAVREIGGLSVPSTVIDPLEASAPIKVELALDLIGLKR